MEVGGCCAGQVSDYVSELSLLPCFGSCEFLMIYDRDQDRFLPIPKAVREAELWQVKGPPPPDKPAGQEWWVVKYVGPTIGKKFYANGQEKTAFHTSLLNSIGFKVVAVVDHDNFKHFNGPKEELFGLMRLRMAQVIKSNRRRL